MHEESRLFPNTIALHPILCQEMRMNFRISALLKQAMNLPQYRIGTTLCCTEFGPRAFRLLFRSLPHISAKVVALKKWNGGPKPLFHIRVLFTWTEIH